MPGESIDEYKTLDSWQNTHGNLPSWTDNTVAGELTYHYETNPVRPVIEVSKLDLFNNASRGAGTEEYTRIDDNGASHKTVFNLKINNYKPMDETQFYADLKDITYPTTFAQMQGQNYYNVIPGYVNVDGGLFTYTVIYHLKDRAKMSAAEKQAVIDNVISTVMTCTNQNFYVITSDWRPVHLKGYTPGDIYHRLCGQGRRGMGREVSYSYKACLEQALLQPGLSSLLGFREVQRHYRY